MIRPLLVVGCGWAGCAARPVPDAGVLRAAGIEALPEGHAAGLSDLARVDGVPWAVAERPAALQRLVSSGAVPAAVRILGLPEGVEPEALAPASSGGWWLGTEAQGTRDADLIVPARPDGADALVDLQGALAVDWAWFGLTAADNAGVEGLCAQGEALVAVGEGVASGPRRAPLARWDGGAWSVAWVPLQTGAGKLSAVACEPEGGLWLIERHYDDLALLYVEPGPSLAPAGGPPPVLTVQHCAVPDAFRVQTRAQRINWEGIAVDGSTLVWLSDNQHASVEGPTYVGRTPRRCR